MSPNSTEQLRLKAIQFVAALVITSILPAFGGEIRFAGRNVELTLSEVSERTVRIELAPLDEQGKPIPSAPSTGLVPFPAFEKLRVRNLDTEREVQVGSLRVTVKTQPLRISLHRGDGRLVQELVFDEAASTNAGVSFRTEAPVLGLGEGAEQFDRRGSNYPLINGQRYRLAELGTRVFSPFLIGTEGWALLVAEPFGSIDLREGQGKFHPAPGAKPGTAVVFITDAREPADAMSEFIRLTGAPVMPPKWALGYMQSHRTLSSEADILAEARTFREKKLPCDTFIFLGTGFCPGGWNFGHDSFALNTNVFVHDPATVVHRVEWRREHV